jgi:hypothetical protein
MSRRRSQLQWIALCAAVTASAICFFGPGGPELEPEPKAFAETATPDPSPDPAEVEATKSRPTALTSVVRAEPTPPATKSPVDLDGHPHPITAEHIRIRRELSLIQSMNDALDLRDAPHLRALLTDYVREYPDDPNAMGAGYTRIVDCLESPSEATREAAQRYYDQERASTLRRYVRRVCLLEAMP